MMIFKRLTFYLAIAGIVGVVLMVKRLRDRPPPPPPPVEPARSPYTNSVAATGLIEAAQENVKLGSPKGGIIQKIFVQVGSRVKSGDPIIQLDDREGRARLASMMAQLDALRAELHAQNVMVADAADQFQRVQKLEKENVASQDERTRKGFQLQNSEARAAKLEADIKTAEAQVQQSQIELEILTIRSPRDGTILQVNVRAGEFAGTTPTEPLLILGEVDKLQVRADVDEQNASLVQPNQPAVAFLKGSTRNPLPLRFVRIEPYVIPKRSLTGDSTERVDTRVLQVIFELDRTVMPLYVGQQVDVFIQRAGGTDGGVARGGN